MSGITSSVGLVTGIPIEDTVNQLMQIAARPRDLLVSRTKALKEEQSAVNALSTRVLGFQFALNKLKSTSLFQSRTATSNNTAALTAAIPTGTTPPVGALQVRPVRTASSQQLISQRFEDLDGAFGSGSLSLRIGGFVDRGVSLDDLNGGDGVQRGKIKITDRSGEAATIDLTYARTVDDVLEAINENGDIAVTAVIDGDAIRLVDGSGGSGNLIVAEVSGGTTAADLGLAGINAAANEATGGDVYELFAGLRLSRLNDGNGVELTGAGVDDIDVTFSDGTEVAIDLGDASTLSDVLEAINAADPTRLSAAISGDGNRLELTDLTGGSGDFEVANAVTGSAATELGIAGSTAGATITGGRLVSGLGGTLLSRLGGGAGLGTLGVIDVTDRNGGADSIDLSSAETLDDLLDLINASTADVQASYNDARNGIVITDTSGGSGNLTIANGDANNSADALGIAVDDAVDSTDSGSLGKQTLSRATRLSSLNNGQGVKLGDIRLTDTEGRSATADLNTEGAEAKTIGDVIDAINELSIGVEARINDTGDGILIVDTVGGTGSLKVVDRQGDVAETLNLTGVATTQDIDSVATKVINGTVTSTVDLSDLSQSEDSVLLSSLNGGAGISLGDVRITDSNGVTIAIDFNGAYSGVSTIGDVIDAINERAEAKDAQNPSGFSVRARLNDNGTGIYLEDTGGGSSDLLVEDANGTTAKSLKLTGTVQTDSDGNQFVNGSGLFASVSNTGTGLQALADRLNNLDAGITATTIFDGIGYRLSLTVDDAGDANELLIDAVGADFQFTEIAKAQDALLLYGDGGVPGAGVLVSSPDNTFENSIGGLNLTVAGASEKPVSVTVATSDKALTDAVQGVVDAYNALRSDLDQLTDFDETAQTTGLLFGTREALITDQRLSRTLTDRYFGLGDLQSLEQLGVSVDDEGKLSLNKTKLKEAFAADPEAIREFFNNEQRGFLAKATEVIDGLVDADRGAFGARFDALQATIDANELRIERYAASLELQQNRLFLQFTQLETIVSKLQANQTALANLQIIPPLTAASN